MIVGSEKVWAGSYADDLAKGKGLHELKCAKCHRLYEPAAYGDEEWDRWMVKMRKKAHLNDDDYRLISSYLDSMRKK